MKIMPQATKGAVGLLSVVLVTAVVLIFSLTLSVQVLLNMKNAKLMSDFNSLYYATEGGMREARIQLKKEDVVSKTFAPTTVGGITVNRAAIVQLTSITVTATGTAASMSRILQSGCGRSMEACTLGELTP